MKKLNYSFRTLDDEIIREGLSALSRLEDFPSTEELSYLVGGVAVQSYLPSSCRRHTADIDVAVVKPLNYQDFKEFSKPVFEYLLDKGYRVLTKNARNRSSGSYALSVNETTDDPMLIEFSRRNKKAFEKHKLRLKRELEKSRQKRVEGKEEFYRVSSPEDIIVPKLVRDVHSLERNRDFLSYIKDFYKEISNEEIEKDLKRIEEFREDAIINIGNPLLSERLRFFSDVYDIRILSELVGVNKTDFEDAVRDWDTLRGRSEERDSLLKIIGIELDDENVILDWDLVSHRQKLLSDD